MKVVRMGKYDLLILLGVGIGFLVTFLIAPNAQRSETTLQCPGIEAKVFKDMEECELSLQVATCECRRVDNVWAEVYGIAMFVLLTLVPAVFLQSRILLAFTQLSVTYALVGSIVLFVLTQRYSADLEAISILRPILLIDITALLGAFLIARSVWHWFISQRFRNSKTGV
jgi:hypothetical protein